MSTATATDKTETRGFQAEVSKLLQLMIHSLYSNRDIFLRELVSNASDACDKLRFDALNDSSLQAAGVEPVIRIAVDANANTLTLSDNGIGMSRDEVIDNLGTLAKSGTADFVSRLSGDQKQDSQLIGQFGVGFYSAFIVAKDVEVFTRRAGLATSEGVHWRSTGEGEYQIEAADIAEQGTRIVLHLRDDAGDYTQQWTLRELIQRYSDHVAFPIQMLKNKVGEEQAEDEWETVNAATALWQRPRQDVSEAEYQSFYQHVSHDYADALSHSHNKVEGALEYTSLLYVPAKAPLDLYQREGIRGLKLYVQRVFIMDDAEQFLPLYLRFIKGVVDVPGLSLNVSRELLQDDGKVKKIRAALSKRVLDMLAKLAADTASGKYAGFWREFGNVLKEGVAEDRDNQEKVAQLLRFYSTSSLDSEAVALDDYVARMPEGQQDIYFLLAENHAVAKASPHLEALKKKGYEVLLLSERIDEWMVTYLNEFKGKKLVNVARGELDLGADSEDDKLATTAENAALIERLQAVLKDEVAEVRATNRLVDSPACLVLGKDELGPQLRRLLEAQGQAMPEAKPVLEVNLAHELLHSMDQLADEARFAELAGLLLDQALLAEGQLPQDSQRLAQRLSKLLLNYANG